MFSDDFPADESGSTWEMDIVYNWCTEEPIVSCDMTGKDDQGNDWDFDCREDQTPTPEKYEEWAKISNDPMWDDEELWEHYGDYFMLWEDRTRDHDDDDYQNDEDHCEDRYLTMSSSDFPADESGVTWEMDIVYNWCKREPIVSCQMSGNDGANEWAYDCREEQTPTLEKYEEWAAIRNDPMWEDEELWEKYSDFYMLWDVRTGHSEEHDDSHDNDDEYYWDDGEYYYDDEDEYDYNDADDYCDEWCEWEYSDWNNYDEDWDEETKAQYWYEKSQITGCEIELQCEFYECEEHEFAEYDSHCWREECNSECGEYLCGLWHQDIETEEWSYGECVEEYDLQQDLLQNAEQAAEFVQAFDQTFDLLLGFACEQNELGECVGDFVEENTANVEIDTTLIEDPMIQDIAQTAAKDAAKALDADEATVEYILNEATPDEIAQIAQAVIVENLGEGWISDLFGSFVEGQVNSGMERKGERR